METEKRIDMRHWALAATKDRAQMTAISAMFAVMITLFIKTIQNPSDTPFDKVVFSFMLSSLAVQLAALLFLLAVCNMRANRKKTDYGFSLSGVCSDFCFCCADPIQTMTDKTTSMNMVDPLQSGTVSGNMLHPNLARSGLTTPSAKSLLLRKSYLSKGEYDAFQEYKDVLAQTVQAELAVAQSDLEREYIMYSLNAATTKLQELQNVKEDTINAQEYKRRLSEATREYSEAQAKKTAHDGKQMQMHVTKRKGEILIAKLENLQDQAHLRRICFWQNIINYLLYLAFLSNLIVVGVGFATTL